MEFKSAGGYWCVIVPNRSACAVLGDFDPSPDGKATTVQRLCDVKIVEAGPGNTFFGTALCTRCREIKELQDRFATMYVEESHEEEEEDVAVVSE